MRKLFAAGCALGTVLMLCVYQFYFHPEYTFLTLYTSTSNRYVKNNPKIILEWTSNFGEINWLPEYQEAGCAVSGCVTTSNRSLLNESSAVVFHWRDVNIQDLPKFRSSKQVWILYNKESPLHTPRNVLDRISEYINWIITYRHDSDIVAPYGKVVTGRENRGYHNKTSLVAWLVSNCHSASKREEYVRELNSYIPIDVYGHCGRKYCTKVSALSCYEKLGGKYKFYLSFENSLCKDYVTEKLYNALKHDMIPVVFGGAQYQDILPPKSYIDALSFPTPKHLADYLLEVANDKDKYEAYFQWKERFRIDLYPFGWLCDVCRKLSDANLNHTTTIPVRDLGEWWYEEAQCKVWKNGKIIKL